MEKFCKHTWYYDHYACCYLLKCHKCGKVTKAYYRNGEVSEGDNVTLDGETITRISPTIKKKGVKK